MAAAYPGFALVGQYHARLLKSAPEYTVIEKEFKDKGRNYGLLTANTVLTWTIDYENLTEAQAAILDAHYADAQGSFEGFNFTDPQTGTNYGDVHYVEYVVDHSKRWIQSRRIRLRKSPAA